MQQHAKVSFDNDSNDDDDDDEDDVKQEVTQTIEKFVQNRHVQTLKYLRHVIDENRHLRLHIEHLKRRQIDPVQSPAVVDPFDPEESPVNEIRVDETPEPPIPDVDVESIEPSKYIDQATNTDAGEDFQAKYEALNDELVNVRKQHVINREEFQRELERVDSRNNQLEKDLKSAQERMNVVEKREHDRQREIEHLKALLADQEANNETLTLRLTKFEQTNRLLTQRLTKSEDMCSTLQTQNEEYQRIAREMEEKYLNLQSESKRKEERMENFEQEIRDLREKLQLEMNKGQEVHEDNEELRESVKYLQEQLQEKVVQEQQLLRERQLNSNFKDFIQVKRNLQACQQENEQLKVELKKLQIKFVNK